MRPLLILLTLVPVLLIAQSPVQGRIVDASTGEGLAFATIAYGSEGTYANADGYYRLNTGAVSSDSVRVFFIGYRTLRTTVAGLRVR